ncbi:MAG: SRPBCC domain-containing protein [Candidatus Cyclobacteriaceae bacterium M3_2C_046]
MDAIHKTIQISLSGTQAFKKFVHDFSKWWPREYTWSQDVLQDILINPGKDGLCTEIGPHGFRCDWGRITAWEENKLIGMKWQISQKREPVPNPDQASNVLITFTEQDTSVTLLTLEHSHFNLHGEGAETYQEMMDSEYGWDYILEKFLKFCQQE